MVSLHSLATIANGIVIKYYEHSVFYSIMDIAVLSTTTIDMIFAWTLPIFSSIVIRWLIEMHKYGTQILYMLCFRLRMTLLTAHWRRADTYADRECVCEWFTGKHDKHIWCFFWHKFCWRFCEHPFSFKYGWCQQQDGTNSSIVQLTVAHFNHEPDSFTRTPSPRNR